MESSHGRGAAEFSELLKLGAQHLIRNMASTKFVSATHPSFLRPSPNIIETTLVKNITLTGSSSHVRSSTDQKYLSQNVQPLPWDDSYGRFFFLTDGGLQPSQLREPTNINHCCTPFVLRNHRIFRCVAINRPWKSFIGAALSAGIFFVFFVSHGQ